MGGKTGVEGISNGSQFTTPVVPLTPMAWSDEVDDSEISQLSLLRMQGVPGELDINEPSSPLSPQGSVSQSCFPSSRFRRLSVTLTETALETPIDISMSMTRTATIEQDLDDCCVRSRWLIFSTFVEISTGSRHSSMEMKFARHKCTNIQDAFRSCSILMLLGSVLQAILAAASKLWSRACLLGFVVAPIFLVYTTPLISLKHSDGRHPFSSKYLRVLCAFQSSLIVLAELQRLEMGYGALVINICFLQNFTPLSEVEAHCISAAFGLFPYVAVSIWRIAQIKTFQNILGQVFFVVKADPQTLDSCAGSDGRSSQILDVITPVVLFVYQVMVTMQRDRSMRIDYLSGARQNMQRRLLNTESEKCRDLLKSMLPSQVISTLTHSEPVEPQHFNDVTVIFIEICDFARLCDHLAPFVVIEVLNILYYELDRLSDLLRVYKVETVGQVYMAVVGCPELIQNNAEVAAHFALAAQKSMPILRRRFASIRSFAPGLAVESPQADVTKSLVEFNIRIGLHSGMLRAGVVGLDSPRYKLVGDTVNTASRMESTCIPGKVQVSDATQQRFRPGVFVLEDRGEVPIKGKGTMRTAFVTGYDSDGPEEQNGMRTISIFVEKPALRVGTPTSTFSPTTWNPKLSEESFTPTRWSRINSTSGAFVPPPPPPRPSTAGTCCDLSGRDVSQVGMSTAPGNSQALANVVDYATGTPKATGGLFLNGRTIGIVDSMGELSRAAALMNLPFLQGKDAWWKNICTHMHLGGEGDERTGAFMFVSRRPSKTFPHQWFLSMMVPDRQPEKIAALREDHAAFKQDTLETRIWIARCLTILWLLLLCCITVVDYFMDDLGENEGQMGYREALLFRVIGNYAAGLVYMYALVKAPYIRDNVETFTCLFLMAQGIAVLACGITIYNNESAVIAIFASYVLLYSVLTILQRLVLCAVAVLVYTISELFRCQGKSLVEIQALGNMGFLLAYFAFLAAGVYLQEHIAHVANYEQRRVFGKLEEIKQAKAAGGQLLMSLLPSHVVDLVNEGVSPIAEHHSDVTVIFTDIKGFTAYSSQVTPKELVDVLNCMYCSFDEIVADWGLHKVEVIGDAYCISAGCPRALEPTQQLDAGTLAMRAVEVALAMQRALPRACDDDTLSMRAGIHTGDVIAGVVGRKGPRYHLFGATVLYAEKMESSGVPGRVQISDSTYEHLAKSGHEYDFDHRTVDLEGERGPRRTWLVNKSLSKAARQIQKKLIVQRRTFISNSHV